MTPRALVGFLIAIACARPAGKPPSEPTTTPTLARADSLYREGQFEEARELWEQAAADAGERGDSASLARILTSIGLAERNLGRYPASRQAGEQALSLKLRLGLRGDLFRSYNALGLLAWDQNQLDRALELFEEAARAASVSGDSVSVAKARNNVGLIEKERGEPVRARDGFVVLRDLSRRVGDSVSLGRALLNLASVQLQLGDALSAVASVEEARGLAARSGDAAAEENALGQLATAYMALGQPQQAFAAIDSALALAQAHGLRRREAEDLQLRGDFYATAGDHRRALEQYALAQAVNLELGLVDEEGTTLRAEADAFRALGHPDTAEGRLLRALTLHRTAGFRQSELSDLLLLAELAGDQGERAGAARALDQARMTARAISTPLAMAHVGLTSARVHDRSGQSAAVLAALDSAGPSVALLAERGTWEPDALRARAFASLGRGEAAEVSGRRAVRALELVRSAYGSGQLRTSYLSGQAAVYADLVVVLLARGKVDEAFAVADGARGRALLEHLGNARTAIEGGDRAATGLLRGEELLRRIDALTSQLRTASTVPPGDRGADEEALTRSLEVRLVEARSEYEALMARLSETPDPAATLLNATPATAAGVRASLRSDELLVEYFVAEDRLHLFAVRTDRVRHVSVPVTAGQLASRVRLARELIGRPAAASDADVVLRELNRTLIEPVATLGGGMLTAVRRLLLVPHGPLVYLPFAALTDAQGGALVSRYALLMLPSASALPALRTMRLPGASAARFGGHVVLAPLPEDLPASRVEARDVSRILGARALIGHRATEAALRYHLGVAPVVHVATHGLLNPLNPMFSRIELVPGPTGSSSDDGRLEVHELLGLTVSSGLVFLSGCETGRGLAWRTGFEQGEDYVTLGQAFLYAGAGNVVATLWRVDDPAAAVFARHFYGALRTGDPVSAVAAAQQAMLADPRYRAPYYWAPYQISGSGRLAGAARRRGPGGAER